MDELYGLCNISRQGHHQQVLRELKWSEKEHLIVGLIIQIREIHPAMGLKTMYEFYKPEAVEQNQILFGSFIASLPTIR